MKISEQVDELIKKDPILFKKIDWIRTEIYLGRGLKSSVSRYQQLIFANRLGDIKKRLTDNRYITKKMLSDLLWVSNSIKIERVSLEDARIKDNE